MAGHTGVELHGAHHRLQLACRCRRLGHPDRMVRHGLGWPVAERKEAEPMTFPRCIHWRSEGLRLHKQPLTWFALGALLLILLATAISEGFYSRPGRDDRTNEPKSGP